MLLRSILRTKPLPRRCLVRCRHCGIFFLTTPCNGGRKDLGCPFGCRVAHRRRESTIRSVAYYRDPKGKRKKSSLNQKRRPWSSQGQSSAVPASSGQASGTNPTLATGNDQSPDVSGPPVSVAESGCAQWNPLLLEYVRMVVSLIEGRPVSSAEILEMLRRFLRQRSLGRRRKIDHTVAWLHEHPP